MNTATAYAFGDRLFSSRRTVLALAQETADANGSPVAVLQRDATLTHDGWYAICEEPPDDMDSDPLGNGWVVFALVEPKDVL